MRLATALFLSSLALACGKSSEDTLYVELGSLKTKTDLIEVPGIICVQSGRCKDYVASWKEDTMNLDRFKDECSKGQILEGKACVRNAYGCVKTSSNEGYESSYTSLDLDWGKGVKDCEQALDAELNPVN